MTNIEYIGLETLEVKTKANKTLFVTSKHTIKIVIISEFSFK